MTVLEQVAPRLARAHADTRRWGSHLPPYAAPNPTDPYRSWSGYLTTENVYVVGKWLRTLFAGQWLAMTTAHEYRGWEPELHTPVLIDTSSYARVARHDYDDLADGIMAAHVPPSVRPGGGLARSWASIGWSAGDYSWGWHSWLDKQPYELLRAAKGDAEATAKLEDDAQDAAYLSYGGLTSGQARTLTIRQRTPEGRGAWYSVRSLEGNGATVLSWEAAAGALAAIQTAETLVPHALGSVHEAAEAREHLEQHVPAGWLA